MDSSALDIFALGAALVMTILSLVQSLRLSKMPLAGPNTGGRKSIFDFADNSAPVKLSLRNQRIRHVLGKRD